jgi:hypothetical protein
MEDGGLRKEKKKVKKKLIFKRNKIKKSKK